MSPVSAAIARANRGLDWSYPCLIWIADYLRDATGIDHASAWREIAWDEATARSELSRLAVPGKGKTAVERAVDAIAARSGWQEAEGPRQGAVMIGVYRIEGIGHPAIFDGQKRWIISIDGRGVTIVDAAPDRMWEVPRG
jgi:hypothetical protein